MKPFPIRLVVVLAFAGLFCAAAAAADVLSLAGDWSFRRDDCKAGEQAKWFASGIAGGQAMRLPGTMDEAKLGVSNASPPSLAGLYRPNTYEGLAWYERQIEIPEAWRGKRVVLFLERVRWFTRAWIDGKPVGQPQDSLIAPHVYDLGTGLAPGAHRLTLAVDNSPKINLGTFVSALYGGTPGNLNGIVGTIELQATDPVWIDDVQVYPDLEKKSVRVKARIGNATGKAGTGMLTLSVHLPPSSPSSASSKSSPSISANAQWSPTGGTAEAVVPLGNSVALWDEFAPTLILRRRCVASRVLC